MSGAAFTSSKHYSQCSRAQLLDLAYVLEEQRDKQIQRAENAEATIARVRVLVDKWVTDRLGYPLDESRASVAFIAVKLCGEELSAAIDGTP